MKPYSDRVPPAIEAYGAKYQTTIEQAWTARKVAIIDTETNGLGGFPWAIGILPRGGDPEAYVQQTKGDPHTHISLAAARVRELTKEGYLFVFHNAKYDQPILGGVGIHIQWGRVLDTQLLAYCWDSSVPSLSLASLTGEKLDYRQSLIDAELLEPRSKKGTEYSIPPWVYGVGPLMTQYLIGDLLATAGLCARLLPMLRLRDPKAWWHFTRIEAPFTRVIVGMEQQGFGFDYRGAASLVARWEAERADVCARAQGLVGLVPGATKLYAKGSYKRGGVVTYDHCTLDLFNPNSVPHKLTAFTRLGWVPTKHTAKGAPSLDEEVLKELSKQEGAIGELATVLREASKLTKYIGMVTGYLAKAEQVGTSYVLRGEFNQTVARTGRLSSSNPNLQNVPTRGKQGELIRALFTSPPGMKVVGCDASNIEARILAHYMSRYHYEHRLAQGFRDKVDFHQVNADSWGVERTPAKTILYSCVPETTMILTRRGFISHDEVTPNDETLGYNFVTGRNEWTRILAVHHYDSAPLLQFSTSRRVVTATPNHRWITDRGYRQKRTAKRMFTREFTDMGCISTEHRIVNTAPATGGAGLDLVGLIHKKEDDSRWSGHVLDMTESERWLWFSANIATDGHMSAHGAPCFSQDVRQVGLTDAMHLCGYLLGYNVSRRPGCGSVEVLRFTKKPHTGMQTAKVEQLPPAPVWCVTTELGSWTMREGNFITLTGNSLYGAGATKIGGGDKAKGQAIMDNVRAKCPAMFDIKDTVWRNLRKGGGVIHTWLGRRLVYSNISSKDRSLKAADERASFNAILQGTAADVFKATILSTAHDTTLICGILVANVHDEGQWYVPEEQADEFACEVTKHFRHDYGLNCPLDGEAKTGYSWHEVH